MVGKNQKNNKWIVIYIIVLFLSRSFSFSMVKTDELKKMFYRPINLNTASEKEIIKGLTVLGLDKAKILGLISFIKKRPRPIQHFNVFIRNNVLTLKEARVISHFFILKDDEKEKLFESEI